MAQVTISNTTYDVIYVDASMPDDTADGLTPSTAKKYFPTGDVEAKMYIMRKSTTRYVTPQGSRNTTLNAGGFAMVGMPSPGEKYYDVMPSEVQTAWGSDSGKVFVKPPAHNQSYWRIYFYSGEHFLLYNLEFDKTVGTSSTDGYFYIYGNDRGSMSMENVLLGFRSQYDLDTYSGNNSSSNIYSKQVAIHGFSNLRINNCEFWSPGGSINNFSTTYCTLRCWNNTKLYFTNNKIRCYGQIYNERIANVYLQGEDGQNKVTELLYMRNIDIEHIHGSYTGSSTDSALYCQWWCNVDVDGVNIRNVYNTTGVTYTGRSYSPSLWIFHTNTVSTHMGVWNIRNINVNLNGYRNFQAFGTYGAYTTNTDVNSTDYNSYMGKCEVRNISVVDTGTNTVSPNYNGTILDLRGSNSGTLYDNISVDCLVHSYIRFWSPVSTNVWAGPTVATNVTSRTHIHADSVKYLQINSISIDTEASNWPTSWRTIWSRKSYVVVNSMVLDGPWGIEHVYNLDGEVYTDKVNVEPVALNEGEGVSYFNELAGNVGNWRANTDYIDIRTYGVARTGGAVGSLRIQTSDSFVSEARSSNLFIPGERSPGQQLTLSQTGPQKLTIYGAYKDYVSVNTVIDYVDFEIEHLDENSNKAISSFQLDGQFFTDGSTWTGDSGVTPVRYEIPFYVNTLQDVVRVRAKYTFPELTGYMYIDPKFNIA